MLRDVAKPADSGQDDPATKPSVLLRVFEVVTATVALVALAPLMALLAVLVRRGSPGPAIFRQQRIGLNGVPFTFLKFRSHYVDARERFPEFGYDLEPDEVSDFIISPVNDPRVTAQGRWLRKTSLDELPNLLHLITGDMTLVGPRPEMLEMDRYYTREMRAKFSVRPGITGLAQTQGRGNLSFQETVALDLEYVRTRSAWGDIKILARTFRLLIAGDEGAH